MEAARYSFIRDVNDKRTYLERDIMPLQKMRELLADGMGMENAAKAVVLRFAEQISDPGTVAVRLQDELRDYLERIISECRRSTKA